MIRCPTCGAVRRPVIRPDGSGEPLSGDLAQSVRKRMGLTQEELGRLFGYTLRSVEAWERGERAVPPVIATRLRKAARQLGVPLRALPPLPSELG